MKTLAVETTTEHNDAGTEGDITASWRVLITRPAGKADNLLASLDDVGVPYVYQPLITTQQVSIKARDLRLLASADYIIFVSVCAVSCLAAQMDVTRLAAPLFAVGTTTASVLERQSGHTVIAPADQRSEGLLALAELAPEQVQDKHVVIIRGNAGRELIKQGLRARGAKVSYVQSYSRVPLPFDGLMLSDQWRQQSIQGIVVTSNEILNLLFQLVPASEHHWLQQRQWIVVSPRMQESALAAGIPAEHIYQAASANDSALLDAICLLRRKFDERS
jgi:uroporphyrinogen-III synthase